MPPQQVPAGRSSDRLGIVGRRLARGLGSGLGSGLGATLARGLRSAPGAALGSDQASRLGSPAGRVPADVRGVVNGRVASWRREADRRRITARHEYAVRARERGIRRARAATARYGVLAGGALVAVPLTHGWGDHLALGALSAVSAARSGWLARTARRRAASPVPRAPILPPVLPPPPPPGSAGWPALHRVDGAVDALRRLAGAVPADIAPLLESADEAARDAGDAARSHAARIAAAEGALRTARAGAAGTELRHSIAVLAADLERAAAALENLVATCARLSTGTDGYDPARQLSVATDEVVARTHGLLVAAATAYDEPVLPVTSDRGPEPGHEVSR